MKIDTKCQCRMEELEISCSQKEDYAKVEEGKHILLNCWRTHILKEKVK